MKLGLLVVAAMAVVVLGPSPSESRIVSKCELKERLDEAITVSKKLQRIKPRLLAVVICEAARRSHLNTELVRVFGKRIPTTTAAPTTTTATTTRPQMANTTTTTRRPTTTTTATTTTTTAPTTTTTTTTRRPTTTTTATTTTTTAPTSTTTRTTAPTSTTTRTTAPTTTELILGINRSTAGSRRKRDAEEENMDELLNEEEGRFDEEELENDDNSVDDDDESVEEEIEQVTEDDEHRHKRSLPKGSKKSFRGRPWSLGLYGIFQLTDSHFCYSGYRWSRNVCQSDCNAFADDDITDDIDCLVKSNYWLYILSNSSRWCRRHARTFLNECH